MYNRKVRGPLIEGKKTLGQITREILHPMEVKPGNWWYIAFGISLAMTLFGVYALYMTVTRGIGEWGVNNTVAWGWDIINFVWWIGIGHAGTAFSIFLLVLRQRWRTSINRSAEIMTVFAVICAALFPLIHMGRVWNAFFLFPYPNTRGPLWVNFNSPLFWDFTAVSAYLTLSAAFWYLGTLPDMGTVRDTTTSKIKKAIYGFFSLGWTGSSRQWFRFDSVAFILGGITSALVVSVHSIVSTDFAVGIEPGWHSTIFPPFFVVGAIFSGFAMVMTLMVIIRKIYPHFPDYATDKHMDAIARILIFISLIMATSYASEIFIAWYSGNEYEYFTQFRNRMTGDYRFKFWGLILCNVLIPQLFWFRKLRRNWLALLLISLAINLGMWLERYIIIITSLSKDYLPANWAPYFPTIIDVGLFLFTVGIFAGGLLLFLRYVPIMAVSELKGVLNIGARPDD
ncbi:MAG: NrfD/PsrC family molybdoenzyme membrane anchor subunit [Bacteroidales bacterium]